MKLKHGAVMVGLFLIASCSPNPVPQPSPSVNPSTVPSPVPIPKPSPPPAGAFDCANPPTVAGFVHVKEPTGKYIVRFKPGLRAQSDVRIMAQSMGATSVRTLAHGFAGIMSVSSAQSAAKRSDVQYVQEDGRKHKTVGWALDRLDQRSLPLDSKFLPTGDGSGVKVVIIDTGVTEQSDFAGRVAPECFSAQPGGCADQEGHGTFVASEVAGKTYGVAKNAIIVVARVLDANGSGSDSDVIAGVEWSLQQKQAHPTQPYVDNMSLGGGISPALDQAICDAIQGGVQIAIAAGNDGQDALNDSPARVWQALTVGASDSSDRMASFSNYGPVLDLFAPGVSVDGVTLTGPDVWDGTSMATPLVTGAMALLLQANPNLTPAQLHSAIVNSATTGKIVGGKTSPNRLLYVGK